MRIRLLPSALSDSEARPQFLTTFLINDTVAIDAGALGFFASLAEQRRIRHVFLSHSHIDHVASLPVFLENVYTDGSDCPTVHASEAVQSALQEDLFNNRLWPDFISLSGEYLPFLKLQRLQEDRAVEVEGLKITPVSVPHTVPTFGFIIEERGAAVVIVSDTGPTREIWAKARGIAGLQAVFLEASFPDSLARIAEVSRHLTPSLFAAEAQKLEGTIRFVAVHIKATHRSKVVEELESLAIPGLEIASPDKEYRF